MTLAIQAFRFAAEPFFFRESQVSDNKQTYAKVFLYFGIFGVFSVLAISLNLDIIKVIVLRNEAYWTGLHIVPILLFASLFLGLYYNLSIWFKISDKTIFGTYISVSAAIITIVLNFLLIPIIGYLGSAITTLVVYLYMCIFAYYTGQRYYPVAYNLKRLGVYLVVGVFLLIAGWNLNFQDFYINQFFKELIVIAFAISIYLSEKRSLRRG